MENLYVQIQTITQNLYSSYSRLIQKYFNTLFLKSSTFVPSITVAGKLFRILRVEEKRINIKVSLQLVLESL